VSICIDKAAVADDGFDQTSYEDGNSTVMFLMKVVCSFFWQLRSIFHDLEDSKSLIKFCPLTVPVLNKYAEARL
jgi:hypothetical protein